MFRYLPDLPPDTPETWTVCDGFHPDRHGVYRTGWMAADYSATGGSEFSWGKAYQTAAGGKGILLIFTRTAAAASRSMLVYNGSSWSERRDATTAIATNSTAICQYGNITLVGTSGLIYQRDATGTSNFATIASSPTAMVLLSTPRNILVALGDPSYTPSGAAGAGSAGWATSDTGDYTNWTTGEAASGSLWQTPGVITGGAVFGNDVIAFKRQGVYRGSYVGGVVKWVWQLIHPKLGAWAPGCVVAGNDRLYFLGDQGFWSYDGTFQRLDHGICKFLTRTMGNPYGLVGWGADNNRAIKLVFDSINHRVCFFNPGGVVDLGTTSGNGNHFSYNVESGMWGYQTAITDTAGVASGVANVLIDDGEVLNTFGTTAGDSWAYNTNVFLVDGATVRVLTTEVSSSLSNYVPKLRTFRLGNRLGMTEVTRAIPQWTLSDDSGTDLSGASTKTATPYLSDSVMEAETAKTAVPLSTDQYRADYNWSSRYQSVELKINCEACISGVEFEARAAGRN